MDESDVVYEKNVLRQVKLDGDDPCFDNFCFTITGASFNFVIL